MFDVSFNMSYKIYPGDRNVITIVWLSDYHSANGIECIRELKILGFVRLDTEYVSMEHKGNPTPNTVNTAKVICQKYKINPIISLCYTRDYFFDVYKELSSLKHYSLLYLEGRIDTPELFNFSVEHHFMLEILRVFDLRCLGFSDEVYGSGTSKIIVNDINQFNKMKLIGLIDFILLEENHDTAISFPKNCLEKLGWIF